MKPARFILNSDYTTVRIREHKKIPITIPDYIEYSQPTYDGRGHTLSQVTYTKANASDSVMIYFTSDRYDYAMPGEYGYTVPEGSSYTIIGSSSAPYVSSDQILFEVRQKGNVLTYRVVCPSEGGGSGLSFRYQGYGQTITAHILSYKDPFSE